ncbi:hypothetical protein BHE74_00055925 [Ensete ventricosum]|uniref:Uncharacterized protein n=1 Tax=Ensete ventricosum TaxID=4639 RepID=A0A427AB61_ENSVE|nr:hypothetical protein B296_00006747 [Ensete ventricosum]RWW10400.1 hypothetical protein GW17_00026061 [Ensete ventricosum]RWW38806.1 hypothetical protein BHE74_00055925 [Ensete ventricosum]
MADIALLVVEDYERRRSSSSSSRKVGWEEEGGHGARREESSAASLVRSGLGRTAKEVSSRKEAEKALQPGISLVSAAVDGVFSA